MKLFVAIMFGCLFLTIHQAVTAKNIFPNAPSSGAICKRNEDCDASERCLTKLPVHRYLQAVQTQAEHSSVAKRNVDKYGYREIPLTPWYGFPYDSDANEDIKSNKAAKRQAKRPATSVHLNYYQNTLGHRDFERIKKQGWVVKNKIKVVNTAPSTFFALLQFPGAYAGIQELKSEHCPRETIKRAWGSVSCGNHEASSCATCPQGHGAAWCNGDCHWDSASFECVSKDSVISCGNHEASSCAACPQGHGAAWCNGDCRWDPASFECVSKGMEVVSCGNHEASSCAACPQGHGAAWCNGDCHWDPASYQCVSEGMEVISCGNHEASSCAACPQGNGAAWCNGDCQWNTASSECVSKSAKSAKSPGICGLAIFSMWNDGSNNVAVINHGYDVDVSPFGGEGTGQRSKKFLKWKPGEVIEFQIEGTYNHRINGWRLKGSFVWKGKRYQMATFERPGDRNILNNFGFSSFAEDFDRGVDANGCQHKRSAEFLNPTIEYKDINGHHRTITFTKARFTKDQGTRPQDRYCKDWTCARSGTTRGSFYLETGGKGSVPSQSCPNNMEVASRNKKRSVINVNSDTVLDTMKFCNAKE